MIEGLTFAKSLVEPYCGFLGACASSWPYEAYPYPNPAANAETRRAFVGVQNGDEGAPVEDSELEELLCSLVFSAPALELFNRAPRARILW